MTTPSARYSIGTIALLGIVSGAIGFSAFEVVIHETSTDEFCLACHDRDIGLEMSRELHGAVHDNNGVGLAVGCADCHLPKAFWPKVVAKTRAGVKDVYHHVLGTIDTPEKFEAHRMHMASLTWTAMNENDSRECRSCHDQASWNLTAQSEKARRYHQPSLMNGKTCIDCHKGIAHKLPPGIVPDEQLQGIDSMDHTSAAR